MSEETVRELADRLATEVPGEVRAKLPELDRRAAVPEEVHWSATDLTLLEAALALRARHGKNTVKLHQFLGLLINLERAA